MPQNKACHEIGQVYPTLIKESTETDFIFLGCNTCHGAAAYSDVANVT
jgi:hypothetical protein